MCQVLLVVVDSPIPKEQQVNELDDIMVVLYNKFIQLRE